jgi:hypothetical protein
MYMLLNLMNKSNLVQFYSKPAVDIDRRKNFYVFFQWKII